MIPLKWKIGTGALVAIIAMIGIYINGEIKAAKQRGRNEVILREFNDLKALHDEYVAASIARLAARDSVEEILRDSLTASKSKADRSAARADSLSERAEHAWREAREELDTEDYERLRSAFDAQDEALDDCSLALKDCGSLTAHLEATNDTLRADLAEARAFSGDEARAREALQEELKNANKGKWIPWAVAGGEALLVVLLLAKG